MIAENFKKLIEKLKQKTISKQVIWSKTSRDNEFKLELQKGAITIDYFGDDSSNKWVDLIIYNDSGDNIDRIAYGPEDGEDYAVLLELHSLANRTYNRVDETIDSIFEELNGNKIVGKKKNDPNIPNI